MLDLRLHLAPQAPWLLLAALTVGLVALAVWVYRFTLPPLSTWSRRLFSASRAVALTLLLWLLAQPVLERALPAAGRRVLVLLDRSSSMDLASDPRAAGTASRGVVAEQAVRDLREGLRGRASVEVRGFAGSLQGDSARAEDARDATALGDALAAIADLPAERRPDGVVVVSDGAINAGTDPVAAARSLTVPVHTLVVGEPGGVDRAIASVESSSEARVGEPTPVRVRVVSHEKRGTPIGVRLFENGRELTRATVLAPGSGAEAVAELRVTPTRAGLAVWSARVDSLAGDVARANDARGVAVPVAPGKRGVLIVSAGLNWDLTFLRRALAGDSTVNLDTRVRDAAGWRALEAGRPQPLRPEDLRGQSVVVLDAIAGADVGPAFDAALDDFVRSGGGLLMLSGRTGLPALARGRLARELVLARGSSTSASASPEPNQAANDLLLWDDDPVRAAEAWRAAAPLQNVAAIQASGGDRVLIHSRGGEVPLVLSRRIGRGPVLMLNGTGVWRWSLSGNDDLQGERGTRLWRRVLRWLSEPVQGEPLRVRPQRWLSASGEPVRLLATLQDDAFRPVAGATLEGRASDGRGRTRVFTFTPRAPGEYEASLSTLPAGRWQVTARAIRAGRAAAVANSEFAVDTWSLESFRAEPDSAALAAIAGASGARLARATEAKRWASAIALRELVRDRTVSTRLWESPWLFALVVLLLSLEWGWRRRRGLP